MKKTVSALMLVILFASTVSAELSGTISTKAMSEYVSTNGLILHDKAVQQTDLFLLFPEGFYGDLWISMPYDGKNNFGKEMDYTLGWNGNIGRTSLIANIGVSYFDCIDVFESKGDIINSYLILTKEIVISKKQLLALFTKIEKPFVVNSMKSGVYLSPGFEHRWNISEKISLSQNISLLYDNGVYGFDKGFIGKYTINGTLVIHKNLSLDMILKISTPISKVTNGRKNEIIQGLGLSYKF